MLQDPQENIVQDITTNDEWWLDAYSLHVSLQGIFNRLDARINQAATMLTLF